MSQHYFTTQHDGRPVTITLGWDRPLGHYFMVIERDDADEEADDEGIVYSNLNERDAFDKPLAYYREKLAQLRIEVPESMFAEVERDAARNVGNRHVWHGPEGIEGEMN